MIDYNFAIISKPFNLKYKEAFDPDYTKALFDFDYALARDGYEWNKISARKEN